MDAFLVALTIILAVVLLLSNFYFMIYYLDPSEKGFSDSWFCKILVLFGLMLAWGQILTLPLDVSNTQGSGGGLDIDLLWQIIYMSVFSLVFALLPFAMFYYESDDEKPVCDRICFTMKMMFFLLVIEILITALLYVYISYTKIPVTTYICEWPTSSDFQATCDQGSTDLEFNVTFPIFAMGMMSWLGWWLVVLFGGVGLSAIPLDFINKFRFRPQRLTPGELASKERLLRARTKELLEIAGQIKIAKSQCSAETSWTARRRLKGIVSRDTSKLQAETLLLEQDYETFLVEKGVSKTSPLWYPFYLFMGFICLCVSILWILQIILYILTRKSNGESTSPFLNKVLIELQSPGTSFLATTIYSALTMYLLLAVIKGCVKFGIRFLWCFRIHPMKPDKTPMNSMLFNTILILFASVAVTLFATNSFAMYTRLSDINNMFGIQIKYLEFFKYFYENNVFEYMLVIWAGLVAIYLCFKNKEKSKLKSFDLEFEKEKMSYGVGYKG
ncbi:unnamed protein product [Blepharisma stoltei]|uniref:Uncharacterized protein n=1 Tax=Blepharisma stoltei TaxID=1481888 RepID=A0AAU9JB93_9CILI|nr:unnamed protein product [Blepharisma stoltei]